MMPKSLKRMPSGGKNSKGRSHPLGHDFRDGGENGGADIERLRRDEMMDDVSCCKEPAVDLKWEEGPVMEDLVLVEEVVAWDVDV